MAHPNEEVVRTWAPSHVGTSTRRRCTWPTTSSITSPDAIHSPGKDRVLAFFRQRSERTGGTFRVAPHDLLANDTHGVALSQITAQREGKDYAWNVVTVYHLKDGKVAECWIHDANQYTADELFA